MQRYNDNILARSGGYVIPAAGASVTVKDYPAGTVATIYSDDGVTPKTNPIVTGSEGEFFFYAADGRYSLEISGGGYTGGNVVDITLDGLGGDLVSSGDLTFTGTGNRITGDFSNSTIANRVMFQTSNANEITHIGAIPNGTGGASVLQARNNPDPNNASVAEVRCNATEVSFASLINGTGTYLPMTTYVGAFENTRQPITGGFLVSKDAGLGYGTGAGGTVTQATSKSTTVTLNKPTGQITMNNAALAAGASVGFIVNNSLAGSSNAVMVTGCSAGVDPGNYRIEPIWTASSSFAIRVTNTSGGSLSEAVVINFAIIKGVTA